MKSNYKTLGDYIQEVKVRNSDLSAKDLLGINIDKFFMPSVANIVGTDLSAYRIVKKNQFACNRMHVGRDYRIPIALSRKDEPFMVSPAYDVFEIKDTKILDPEFLMMWFSRGEYDRNAWFYTDADVRGGLPWKSFVDMKFPLLSPSEQKALIAEYKTIQDRIKLNHTVIQKLEETARTIYKEWFVTNIDRENLPIGWRMGSLEDLYQFQYGLGNNNPDNGGGYPVYGSNGKIGGYHEFNNDDAPVIGHIGANCGSVVFAWGKHFVTYNGVMCKVKDQSQKWFSYVSLLQNDLAAQTRGSSQPFVSYDMLYEIPVVIPNSNFMEKYNVATEKIFEFVRHATLELDKLEELRNLLLAKMASA